MSQLSLTKNALPKIVALSAALAVYAYGTLWLMEQIIRQLNPGYPFSGNLLQPSVLCFCVTSLASYFMHRNKWPVRTTFFVVPLCVFVPLIFFSTGVDLIFLEHNTGYESILQRFCGSTEMLTCGPGYANIVFMRILRSVPAVITVPLFYFILSRLFLPDLINFQVTPFLSKRNWPLSSNTQINDIITDIIISGRQFFILLYLNLSVGIAIFCMTSLLAVQPAYTYALISVGIIAISSLILERAKTADRYFKYTLVCLSMTLLESILIVAMIINQNADVRADSFAISALVMAVSFLTIPVAARLLKPFMISRFILYTVCAYLIFTGTDEVLRYDSKPLDYMIPVLLLYLINIAIGVWSHRTHYHTIETYQQIDQLQQQTERQNRNLDLALNTLEQEKSEKEDAFEFTEKLFHFLGHDLRQPINALSYMLFHLQSSVTEEEDKKTIHLARESVSSANQMVADIMQLSTQKDHQHDIDHEIINIQDIFDLLYAEYHDQIAQTGGQLRVVPTSANLRSHRASLIRSLRNLLSNALKYAPGTTILLGIRHRVTSIEIQIIDRGPGIEAEDQAHIFSPFKRSDKHKNISGHGLGLAVTKELIRIAGGTIMMESVLNKGTRFSLLFQK